jgi:pectinesterase
MNPGIVFQRYGRRALKADVFFPMHKTARGREVPKGAVLLVFGGGWRSGDRTHNYAMCKALANAGYVAVTADYRLSPEAQYPAAIHDLKAALRWMKRNADWYGYDPSRIAVLGCSAGGQLAALVGTTNGDPKFEGSARKHADSRVQAIVDIDGTLAFHHPESVEGKVAAEWLGGTYAERPDLWEEAAPLNHVSQTTPPVLFVNSSIPRFHAGRDDMICKLDSLGVRSDVKTFEDTPHPFWFFNPWFDPMMQHIITFLNRNLK